MSGRRQLPPGQWVADTFPRFGLRQFANRFPKESGVVRFEVDGDLDPFSVEADQLAALDRVHEVSDFHCVTTWSKTDLAWSGVRFADFFDFLVAPRVTGSQHIEYVVIQGEDGYRTGMHLRDLMCSDVLLADQLGGKPLTVAHGAPIRLVAPAHYGYKSVKYIKRLDFHTHEQNYRRAAFRFMDHPRARVAKEERGLVAPGWLLRWLYRPLVFPTIRRFEKAMSAYAFSLEKPDAK